MSSLLILDVYGSSTTQSVAVSYLGFRSVTLVLLKLYTVPHHDSRM